MKAMDLKIKSRRSASARVSMGNSVGIVLMLNPTDHSGSGPFFTTNHKLLR